ncbi:MAG TPA: hypothetical protein VH143_15775 [Kofleriaceae bacterium]|nr:hypothetical protein [Kofleriaceae bacterium]
MTSACNVTSQVAGLSSALPPALPSDVFATLADPSDAHAALCAHDANDTAFPDDADRITKAFCRSAVPQPGGLGDLLTLLGLDFADPSGGNGTGGNPAFAILGHSSALTAREVSAITPTAFVFTPLGAGSAVPTDYAFLAYDPGESFVEVAAYSPIDIGVDFYLVLFDKACTTAPAGCSPNDMLTPNQTVGWSNVRIYESTTALDDTIADCRQCHIGAGHDDPTAADPMILRMQELAAPHTHWFSAATSGGMALLDDFHAAHGGAEDYGPIPAALIDTSDPDQMAAFITAAGFGVQPNAFPSAAIEQEVASAAPMQPEVNVPMGASATWTAIYQAAASGTAITAPYHDVKVTDPDKLAQMTAAYTACRTGGPPLADDIREVLLESGLADMGFAPPAGADGKAMLVQQCQQCHNARLDPTLTRERFLVDQLDQMSRAEKDLAIARLQTPTDTRLAMPPPLFRLPSDTQRAAMIAALQN